MKIRYFKDVAALDNFNNKKLPNNYNKNETVGMILGYSGFIRTKTNKIKAVYKYG